MSPSLRCPDAERGPPASRAVQPHRAAAAACAALAIGWAAGCATPGAQPPARVAANVLVAHDGAPLYTFDRDLAGSGRSQCQGPCAAAWPPLQAAATAGRTGDWSVLTRDDGSLQWAYKGRPLHRRSGEGPVPAGWRAARP
jgi:predicted lipoprotein with Yx(FWY)xxD motif